MVTICEIENKLVVAAEIPGVEVASRPVFYAGVGRIKGSYIRVGDGDLPMTEYEIYSYEAFRKRIHDDVRVVDHSRLELLNSDKVEKYLTLIKQDKVNLAQNTSNDMILELMAVTYEGKPTLAGVMTFSLYPQTYFPQLCITAVVVPGTELGDEGADGERFIDNKRITGSIPEMLDEAVEFVRRNSRTKTIIDEQGNRKDKLEYPLNALVHRDYSFHTENTPITIEMYRDRMEIKNSGGLYGAMTLDGLGKIHPETRNVALANMLEVLQVTENRYSGIPTIYKEFEIAGLPKPEFDVKRGQFQVIFKNNIAPILDEIDKTDMLRAIELFCKVPRSRQEIVGFTGKSRYYVMSTWVQPLVECGRLELLYPDKPKSSKQRYFAKG